MLQKFDRLGSRQCQNAGEDNQPDTNTYRECESVAHVSCLWVATAKGESEGHGGAEPIADEGPEPTGSETSNKQAEEPGPGVPAGVTAGIPVSMSLAVALLAPVSS
jgi:hypothetical protein